MTAAASDSAPARVLLVTRSMFSSGGPAAVESAAPLIDPDRLRTTRALERYSPGGDLLTHPPSGG